VSAGEDDAEPSARLALGPADREPRAVREATCEASADTDAAVEGEAASDGKTDAEGVAVLETSPVGDTVALAMVVPQEVALGAGEEVASGDAEAPSVPDSVAQPLAEEVPPPAGLAEALRDAVADAAPLWLPAPLDVPLGDTVPAPALAEPSAALGVAAPCCDADATELHVSCALAEGRALPHAVPLSATLSEPPAVRESVAVAPPLGVLPSDAMVETELHALALCERDADGETLGDEELDSALVTLPLGETVGVARAEGELLPLRRGKAEEEGQGDTVGLPFADAEALLQKEVRVVSEGENDAASEGVASAAVDEGESERRALSDARPDSVGCAAEVEGEMDWDAAAGEGVAEEVTRPLRDALREGLAEPQALIEGETLIERGGVPLAEAQGVPLFVTPGVPLEEAQGVPLRELLPLPVGVEEAHGEGFAAVALPATLPLLKLLREALTEEDTEALRRGEAVLAPLLERAGMLELRGEAEAHKVENGDCECETEGDVVPLLEPLGKGGADNAALPDAAALSDAPAELLGALPVGRTERDAGGRDAVCAEETVVRGVVEEANDAEKEAHAVATND